MDKPWTTKRRRCKAWVIGSSVAFGLLLGVWVFSSFYTWRPGLTFYRPQFSLGCGKAMYHIPGNELLAAGPLADELEFNGFSGNIFDWPHAESRVGIEWPYVRHYSDGRQVYSMPLWIPTAMCLLLVAFSVWRFRQLSRCAPGVCSGCRYNLTGNESGTCPECGTAIEQPTSVEAPG